MLPRAFARITRSQITSRGLYTQQFYSHNVGCLSRADLRLDLARITTAGMLLGSSSWAAFQQFPFNNIVTLDILTCPKGNVQVAMLGACSVPCQTRLYNPNGVLE